MVNRVTFLFHWLAHATCTNMRGTDTYVNLHEPHNMQYYKPHNHGNPLPKSPQFGQSNHNAVDSDKYDESVRLGTSQTQHIAYPTTHGKHTQLTLNRMNDAYNSPFEFVNPKRQSKIYHLQHCGYGRLEQDEVPVSDIAKLSKFCKDQFLTDSARSSEQTGLPIVGEDTYTSFTSKHNYGHLNRSPKSCVQNINSRFSENNNVPSGTLLPPSSQDFIMAYMLTKEKEMVNIAPN